MHYSKIFPYHTVLQYSKAQTALHFISTCKAKKSMQVIHISKSYPTEYLCTTISYAIQTYQHCWHIVKLSLTNILIKNIYDSFSLSTVPVLFYRWCHVYVALYSAGKMFYYWNNMSVKLYKYTSGELDNQQVIVAVNSWLGVWYWRRMVNVFEVDYLVLMKYCNRNTIVYSIYKWILKLNW